MEPAAESSSLFAYGTLSLPPVFEALTGRRLPSRPAVLEGYAGYRVRGEVFPAAVPRVGARLRGDLYEGIGPADWTLLDRFEGSLYERSCCRVHLEDGRTREAFAYLLAPGREGVLSQEGWRPEEFTLRHLERYLEACRALREARDDA